MTAKPCLYLVSSSASPKYVIDCLDVLAQPRGLVQHFRYRTKHLDESLQALVPKAPASLPSELRDVQVVVLFVFAQSVPGEDWRRPNPHVPLRCGQLVDAYSDGDVTHFFFTVAGYISYPERKHGDLSSGGPRAAVSGQVKRLANLGTSVLEGSDEVDDSAAFQSFVNHGYNPEEWRTLVAGTAPLDVTYEIIFYRVGGLLVERVADEGTSLQPVLPVIRQLPGWPVAEYPLQSGAFHHIKLLTQLRAPTPAELPGGGDAELHLRVKPDHFETPRSTTMRIASSYDLWYWAFVPRGDPDSRSELRIDCEHLPHSGDDQSFVRRQVAAAGLSLPTVFTKA